MVGGGGQARADIGAALFAYGCGGLMGLAGAGAVLARRPDEALAADIVLMIVSLVLAATVASSSPRASRRGCCSSSPPVVAGWSRCRCASATS
jgi:predicted MFS family arabinose efflux permease